MTNVLDMGPLTAEEQRAMRIYYVIYSIDIMGGYDHLVRHMDPNKIGAERGGAVSLADRWDLTEGDEQYEFGYLADDERSGACRECRGAGTNEMVEKVEIYRAPFTGEGWDMTNAPQGAGVEYLRFGAYEPRPCEACRGTGTLANSYRNGLHRKWVGELTHDEFLALANDRGWGLDDDERPTSYENTMGSITEYGRMDAYAVDDEDGWYDASTPASAVIWAQFYVSEGQMPLGATLPLTDGE